MFFHLSFHQPWTLARFILHPQSGTKILQPNNRAPQRIVKIPESSGKTQNMVKAFCLFFFNFVAQWATYYKRFEVVHYWKILHIGPTTHQYMVDRHVCGVTFLILLSSDPLLFMLLITWCTKRGTNVPANHRSRSLLPPSKAEWYH